MFDFEKQYQYYLTVFNNKLDEFTSSILKNEPKELYEGICYALQSGGKRIRPIILLATAECLGVKLEEVLDFAVSVEMIHTYSLVHDDLPAMDNDDYRRGKLSTHKKYGEANGILIGDALLNLAFENAMAKINFAQKDLQGLKILADYAGSFGMIKGQFLDLKYETIDDVSEEILYNIHINKTSKLLTAPLLIASALGESKYFNELKAYGENLGVLFQITDDIMDVEGSFTSIGKTPHKDAKDNKLTSIKIFGLTGAKQRAKVHYDKCKEILNDIPNSEFLRELTRTLYKRNS